MVIHQIEIANFKLFEKATFKFKKDFNIIIGINGSGKTSLLRAIAVSLGGCECLYKK